MRRVVKHTATFGRDKGKTFLITEMSSYAGMQWATAAVLLLIEAGVKVPDNAKSMGIAAVADLDFSSLTGALPRDKVQNLLAEFNPCIQYAHGTNNVQALLYDDNSQIEEFVTWYELYAEVFKLHVNFSSGAKAPNTASTGSSAQAA